MNSFVTGATGSVGNGRAQALPLAGHTVMGLFVFHRIQ
jgi:NADP-dependent 3-hydroxy acid dehydrogenase YdfG